MLVALQNDSQRGLRGPLGDLDDGAGRAESGHHSVKVQLYVPVPGFLVRQVVGGALEDTLEKMDVLLRAG